MKKLKIILIGLFLFGLGFFREFIFENINIHLHYLWNNKPNPYIPSTLIFLEDFEYYELYYSKFLLILVFTIIYLIGSILIVKQFFEEKIYRRYTAYFFLFIFGLSILIFGVGTAINLEHESYGISRKLIEFIQSPLASFFLIPAFTLIKRERSSQQ